MTYKAVAPPPNPAVPSLTDWAHRELLAVERSFFAMDMIILKKTNVVPPKLIEGMVVFADGTNWNPGSGIGFYGYHSGAWNKLG